MNSVLVALGALTAGNRELLAADGVLVANKELGPAGTPCGGVCVPNKVLVAALGVCAPKMVDVPPAAGAVCAPNMVDVPTAAGGVCAPNTLDAHVVAGGAAGTAIGAPNGVVDAVPNPALFCCPNRLVGAAG